MNYVKNKAGKCEMVQDPFKGSEARHQTEKEEDCAIEGFYYLTQGYRKIPGNKCYSGVKLDPVKKPCSGMAFVQSLFNLKTIGMIALLGAVFYYGWPILEAIMHILPISGPNINLDSVKNVASSAQNFVSSTISSAAATSSQRPTGYSQNLDQQPEAFMNEDDDSEEDIGKTTNELNNLGLDYDSDEKDDNEQSP